ncbi:MAG: RHS repeat-associated core domain-containing protein [Brumimicrobium sp.]
MLKILLNTLIITFFALISSYTIKAQQVIHDNIITLDQPDQGNKIYMADERVEFLPGYEFESSSSDRMEAFIEKSVSYSDLYSSNQFNSLQLDNNKEIGKIESKFNVSQTGAASYFLPIEIPKGVNNLQPNLSIEYNSFNPNDILGMGWTLNGVSSIKLSKKHLYRDGESQGLMLDGTDKFELDNNRLYAENGSYGDDGTIYSTEIDNFSRVTSHGNGTTPDYFTLETKEGVIIEYGNSKNSFFENENSIKVIYSINKIIDKNGNHIDFIYESVAKEIRLKQINYGGHSSNLNHVINVEFKYQQRQDKKSIYYGGVQILKNSVLKEVIIKNSGQKIHSYSFEYGYNNASYLKKVSKESSNSSLNPIHFKYGEQIDHFPLETLQTFQNVNPNTEFYAGGDYNGDGLLDLFAKQFITDVNNTKVYIKWIIYTNNGDNTFDIFQEQPIQIGQQIYGNELTLNVSSQTQHIQDFTGNGRADIVTYQVFGDEVNGYIITDITINEFSENSAISTETIGLNNTVQDRFNPEKGLQIGDFTGDGLSDIMVLTYNESDMIYHGLLVNFGPSGPDLYELDLVGLKYLNASEEISLSDFNGDGKTDLSVLYPNSLEIFDFKSDGIGSNTYNENKVAHINNPLPSNFSNHSELKIRPSDFNQDGNTDFLIYKEDGSALIVHSDGVENIVEFKPFNFQGTPTFPALGISGMHNSWLSGVRIVDIDKNGISDIVHIYRNYAQNATDNNIIDVYSYNGEIYEMERIEEPFLGGVSLTSIPFMDFNGDGFLSLFNCNSSNGTVRLRSFNPINSKHNLLTNIKDEFLNEIQINYDFLPQNDDYEHKNNPAGTTPYVLRDIVPTIPIVKSVLTPSPVGTENEVSYKYKGGKAGFRGIGFLGFLENETIDLVNEKKSISEKTILRSNNQTAHPNLFVPFQVKNSVLDLNGNDISEVEFTSELTVYSGLRFDLEVTKSVQTDHLNKVITVTDFTYDNNKNLTEENSKIYSNNTMVQHVVNEYSYNHFGTSLGFDNKLTQQKTTVSRPNEQSFITEENYNYNSNKGNLIQRKTNVNTPFEITEKYNHDIFGNVIKTTIQSQGHVDRVTETQFDNHGRLPIKLINEMDQESTIQYHPLFDKPVSITDVDGLVSTATYDDFGRVEQTVSKDGIVTEIEKSWFNTNPPATNGNPTNADDLMWFIKTTTAGQPNTWVYYNCLGQKRMKVIQGKDAPIATVSTYNEKGQVVAQTDPFLVGSSNINFTENTYDDYNRISTVEYNNEITSHNYEVINGELITTITNPDGTTSKTYQDASGQLIKSQDNGGLTEYSYFSHGGMKEVKVNNEITASSEYDVLGRQTKLIDVNAGETSYEYNAFGDITESVNANNEVKTYAYDDFGRLEQTNNNGHIVNYEYITSGQGINNIEKITTSDHEQTFEYDMFNRLVKSTEIIEGESFEFEYILNNLNQQEQVIYPNGFVVNNIYDNNGYLVKVEDGNNSTLWEGFTQDAFGRFVSYKKGDGVITQLFYDAFQNLEEINAGSVQHHIYNWNSETGNLSKRQDINKQIEELFEYDNLNRLTKARAAQMNSGLVLNNIEMNYAPNGNITDKTDAGDYEYHPTKPNAVTEVTNDIQDISLLTQDITYNALNKASTITEGDNTLEFLYGHDKQRRKTTFYDQNGLAMEKYFVGLYEKEVEGNTTRHINYVNAGDGMTAIVLEEEENGTTETETYFTYKDHLGSIVALTDESGNVVLEQSFDPWGRYRNSSNWTQNNITESPTWLRGYTGHEHLPHFDLINMNGRIYDPILGRMLSPDNYVQDPLFSQSYNRYSYVWNNPLRYTDPSGEFAIESWVTGFVDGFFSEGSSRFSNAWQEANHRGWHSLKITGGLFASDPNKKFLGRSWEIISRLTWQAPQTGLGLGYSQAENYWGGVESVEYFHGSTVVENSYDALFFGMGGRGIALGSYINVENKPTEDLKRHEYGHYLQSQVAGPLFITKYGLPSLATGYSFGYQGYHDDLWIEKDADERAEAFFSDNKTYKAKNFKSTNPQWHEYSLFYLTPQWTPEQIIINFMLNRLNPSP